MKRLISLFLVIGAIVLLLFSTQFNAEESQGETPSKNYLPKISEEEQSILLIIGIAITGSGAILGVYHYDKKKT